MESKTHLHINPHYVGQPIELESGFARARLETHPDMVADDRGLIHGGFTFGLADYAAMLAVNDPFVVLGAAATRFLAPVTLGETMIATATVQVTPQAAASGKKRVVTVSVDALSSSQDSGISPRRVFEGEFTCFVLRQHVLDPAAARG